jgi:hypothetical protein
MDDFIFQHDPANAWNDAMQNDLVKKFEHYYNQEAWDELAALAVASRQGMYA